MARNHNDEFKREAVRIALTSGLTRRQVASDLGIGFSTLAKWVQELKPDDLPPASDIDLAKENERLGKENRLLLEEREVLKKRRCSLQIKASAVCICVRAPNLYSRRPTMSYFGCYIAWIQVVAWAVDEQSDAADMVLLAHIREQYHHNLGSYGRPRMTQELKELGLNAGHRRIGRLMRQNDLRVVRTRKYKATTNSNHKFNIAPNWLDRNFSADRPNQKWAADITYIWTREGWLYLAVMIDLHSRRVVRWSVSNRLKHDLAVHALDRAVALRSPPAGCVHHSDRGSQYCSHDYQKRLRHLGFKISMSGKGNCYDNAAVETFFKTLKAELIWRHSWQTRQEVTDALFKYINGFYNIRRRHSAIGGISPADFERKSA